MRISRIKLGGLLVILLIGAGFVVSGSVDAGGKGQVPPRTSVYEWKLFDVNRMNCTVASDGPFIDMRRTGRAGLEWPKGSGKTAVFSSGIWIIGRHSPSGELRTAVQEYNSEYKPGPILAIFNTTTNDPSAAGDAEDPRYRIYRINRSDTIGGINPDYDEWPADLGAPVDEAGGPLFFGNQQLWTVYNDVDSAAHRNLGATAPMGMEVQSLYYGSDRPGVLENTMFIRWLLINKSDATYENTYFSIWADGDLGSASDDLFGTDSLLNMAFVYNGDEFDESEHGYGNNPPALGYLLLQGPIVEGSDSDSARFRGEWIKGYRNLAMTSTSFFGCGDPTFLCPASGSSSFAPIAYGFLQGLNGHTGSPWIDPSTGQPSTFIFSGDPVAGTGWLPSASGIDPMDIYFLLSSGPFTLAPGDTQEVVAAVFLSQGSDRLNSVEVLKQDAMTLRSLDPIVVGVKQDSGLPKEYVLHQNYPNPFNPATTIRYVLPRRSYVVLKIYNLLGQEVATLVDDEKGPGRYEVRWAGSGFASGLYFYKIMAGEFADGKKLILLR